MTIIDFLASYGVQPNLNIKFNGYWHVHANPTGLKVDNFSTVENGVYNPQDWNWNWFIGNPIPNFDGWIKIPGQSNGSLKLSDVQLKITQGLIGFHGAMLLRCEAEHRKSGICFRRQEVVYCVFTNWISSPPAPNLPLLVWNTPEQYPDAGNFDMEPKIDAYQYQIKHSKFDFNYDNIVGANDLLTYLKQRT
jgi:hypothetical protein